MQRPELVLMVYAKYHCTRILVKKLFVFVFGGFWVKGQIGKITLETMNLS